MEGRKETMRKGTERKKERRKLGRFLVELTEDYNW